MKHCKVSLDTLMANDTTSLNFFFACKHQPLTLISLFHTGSPCHRPFLLPDVPCHRSSARDKRRSWTRGHVKAESNTSASKTRVTWPWRMQRPVPRRTQLSNSPTGQCGEGLARERRAAPSVEEDHDQMAVFIMIINRMIMTL